MLSSKPIVAVGADHPLEDEILMADYFRKPPLLADKYLREAYNDSQMGLMVWLACIHRFVTYQAPQQLTMLT